jgi:hypothetical protein
MGVAEVVGSEGDGEKVSGKVRLWKSVEKVSRHISRKAGLRSRRKSKSRTRKPGVWGTRRLVPKRNFGL